MRPQMIVFKFIASLLTISCVFSSEIGVPVLLWQQKTDANLFDSKSTVDQIDGKILAEDYLTNTQTIVAFVQNRLSLEQFTTEEEERLTAVTSIFKDKSIKPVFENIFEIIFCFPLLYPLVFSVSYFCYFPAKTLLIDVLNPTEALTVKHFERQEWNGIHVKNGDKVWVELPEDSLAENNQLLAELMAEIQKNVSKNALFLITGRQNQFQTIDLEPQSSQVHKRTVRDVSNDKKVSEERQNDYLIEVDDCLYLYTTSITLNDITGVPSTITMFDTGNVTASPESRCWTQANHTDPKPAFLEFKLKDVNQTTEMTLKLKIENKGNNYFWNNINSSVILKSSEVDLFKSEVELQFIDNQIESEQWFGFSCSQFNFKSKAKNISNVMTTISLTFSRLQLQPFKNPHNRNNAKSNQIFTEAFDCEVWMTLPLWMGLLTLIVMFLILYIGLYFIAIVSTPDRFENPKGKPLVISAIED